MSMDGGDPREALVTSTQNPGDLIPRPDPTALTATAVANAKEDLRRELAQLREILEARMTAMDNERKLLLQIMNERSAEVDRRFGDRDTLFTERDAARQEAVRTALAAARELGDARDVATDKANEKFETSVREQMRQLAELASANRDLLDGKIDALKERIDRADGTLSGAAGQRTERRLDTGLNYTAASVLIGFLLLAVALYAALHH
jgi:hypothetical protein